MSSSCLYVGVSATYQIAVDNFSNTSITFLDNSICLSQDRRSPAPAVVPQAVVPTRVNFNHGAVVVALYHNHVHLVRLVEALILQVQSLELLQVPDHGRPASAVLLELALVLATRRGVVQPDFLLLQGGTKLLVDAVVVVESV